MKRFLLLLPLLLVCSLPVHAQVGNTTTIRFAGAPTGACAPLSFGINSATGQLSDCLAGVWHPVGGGGGVGVPAAPSGSIQYNNAGAFGALAEWANGKAACDGFSACDVFITSTHNSQSFMAGTNSLAPMGNNWTATNTNAGDYELAQTNGTAFSSFNLDGTDGGTLLTANDGSHGATGLTLYTGTREASIGRFQLDTSIYSGAVANTDFTVGANWGSTASAAAGGADNLFHVTFTTGGTGIAANPQFTFTYHNGDMSSGGSTVYYVCSQTGGNDILADVTTITRNQTNEIFQWNGTPTTGKTYEITCFGAAAN